MYTLSLKNYTDIDNNIIYAFSQSLPNENIKKYIEKFNTSVLSGVNVYSAFETLKEDINIEEVSQFINLLQNCYINGGNFSQVIDKYSKLQTKVNIQKEKQNQELQSSKITLIVLICLSFFMVFGFVLNNEVYKDIILNTVGGKIILTVNMLTYIVMYIMYLKIVKMEV